ncbi:bd68738e-4cac-4afb-aae9-a5e8103d92a6 [Thermothielavioides terrestris]|uniref:Uncharacterized protein n=2 Tax=Thermothielavioides terrestris TaxID=2587410 RepID=G2R1A6_THETT|nr:uncharacterized protein THITE_2111175 [Thermothielavioides terrestris NRRL 8126]AEO64841.1 hypothetical protein THITE_2111175 [Thermothielavioides terrestris NRRL 8126]SPQ19905.1 bd68738e-4cac-4afb-aae9-a5e8103d92a6 [Thermothielavioides terrestris]
MKFQLVTAAAAAIFVASVSALPAPVVDNHGLIPDTDNWVEDGTIEAIQTRDTEDAEIFEARDVDATEDLDARDSDAIEDLEFLEARDEDVTEVTEESSETLQARDTDEVTETLDVLEARTNEVSEAAANFNFTTDFNFALDNVLSQIEGIPEDVLQQGDEALHKWLVDHGIRAGDEKLKRDTDGGEEASDEEGLSLLERGELVARASWWKIAKCVAAIVQLLATTAVPAAKLLRIKKYIEELGGAKQAVELLLKATTKSEKLKAGGEALVALSAELLGISSVKNNCF